MLVLCGYHRVDIRVLIKIDELLYTVLFWLTQRSNKVKSTANNTYKFSICRLHSNESGFPINSTLIPIETYTLLFIDLLKITNTVWQVIMFIKNVRYVHELNKSELGIVNNNGV